MNLAKPKTDSLCSWIIQYTDPIIIKMESNEWTVVKSQVKKRARKISEVDDEKCTFCKRYTSECGGDHVDEMRDIARQQRTKLKQ
jgi:hypothetical protein